MDYKDGPECIDKIYTRYYSNSSGGVFAEDPHYKPIIKKISKHSINSIAASEEIRWLLEESTCPICKQKPDPLDTIIYRNPYNGQYSWFCNTCRKKPMYLWKWDCWHIFPAYKRKMESLGTEEELYDYIVAHNGTNINQLKDALGWTYGKVRGACMRLQAKGLIIIQETNEHGYRESKVYINTDGIQ